MRKDKKTKQKKMMKTRTKFVILAMLNITMFTVTCLALAYMDKTVPDTLIAAFFAAWTLELGLLAGIKIKSKDEE